MKKPKLYEIETRLKKEFKGLELEYQKDKHFDYDILVHDNEDHTVEIYVRDVETDYAINGYLISFGWIEKHKVAGGGFSAISLDDLIERVSKFGIRYFALNDYEQMTLF